MTKIYFFLSSMKWILLPVLIWYIPCVANAQFKLEGEVYSAGSPVPFATVLVRDQAIGTLSDSLGRFRLVLPQKGHYTVQISAVGYRVEEISVLLEGPPQYFRVELLAMPVELIETQIVSTPARIASLPGPLKVESISQTYIKSIPFNNLSETLDFINGLQQVVSCGVCATGDIHINGMEGAYTLLLMDGMPVVSALGSVYGLSGIPNQIIDRLEISKGPSAIQYGTEAMGGVINVVTKRPSPGVHELHVESAYSSHHQRMINVAFNSALGNRSAFLLATSHSGNDVRYDFNGDGFTDIPTISRWSVFGKYTLDAGSSFRVKSSLRLLDEERFGGQLHWQRGDRGSDRAYGEWIRTQRAEWLNHIQFTNFCELQTSLVGHLQNSYYGLVHLSANQYNGFSHFLYKNTVGFNKLRVGLNHRWQRYSDNSVVSFNPYQQLFGAYIQDQLKLGSRLEALLAIRADKHNLHGPVFSPQFNVSVKLSDFSSVRFNAGRGFRAVNLFTEDHAALSGSRQIQVTEELKPERSNNFTFEWSHTYNLRRAGYGRLALDVFHNYFSNRILADYNVSPSVIVYSNGTGSSIARGFSASVQHSIQRWCFINFGYTMLDSFQRSSKDSTQRPQLLTPKHLVTLVCSVMPHKLLECSVSARMVGSMHLPEYEAPFERSLISQKFAMLNVQFKWLIKPHFDLTLAIRNLTNFTQESPLVDASNPFGPNFDTAYVYGPLQVRNVQASLSWSISKTANKQSALY